jgi:hypothetical protein
VLCLAFLGVAGAQDTPQQRCRECCDTKLSRWSRSDVPRCGRTKKPQQKIGFVSLWSSRGHGWCQDKAQTHRTCSCDTALSKPLVSTFPPDRKHKNPTKKTGEGTQGTKEETAAGEGQRKNTANQAETRSGRVGSAPTSPDAEDKKTQQKNFRWGAAEENGGPKTRQPRQVASWDTARQGKRRPNTRQDAKPKTPNQKTGEGTQGTKDKTVSAGRHRNNAAQTAGTRRCRGKHAPTSRNPKTRKHPTKKTGEGTQGTKEETAASKRQRKNTAYRAETQSGRVGSAPTSRNPKTRKHPKKRLLCCAAAEEAARARDVATVWRMVQRQGPAGKATPNNPTDANQTKPQQKNWLGRSSGQSSKMQETRNDAIMSRIVLCQGFQDAATL